MSSKCTESMKKGLFQKKIPLKLGRFSQNLSQTIEFSTEVMLAFDILILLQKTLGKIFTIKKIRGISKPQGHYDSICQIHINKYTNSSKFQSKAKKKQKALSRQPEDEAVVHAPHSFIIVRGLVGPYVRQLMKNWRQVMSPYTAARLKVNPYN